MTSHDAVACIRRVLGKQKVGHTGTLDPEACGVLPVCVGKATRLAEYALQHSKSYRAEILFGIKTDSQDLTGTVLEETPFLEVRAADLEEVFRGFLGESVQDIPAFSAVKYRGQKMYQMARKGIPVPEKRKTVSISGLSLFRFYAGERFPRAIVDVNCSSGTYIRSLCADIGTALGCAAVMSFLIRTASGPFCLADSVTLEESVGRLGRKDYEFLLPGQTLVEHLPAVYIGEGREENSLKNGMTVQCQPISEATFDPRTPVRVMREGRLLAIGCVQTGDEGAAVVKPKKVLA